MPVPPASFSVPVRELEARFEQLAKLASESRASDGSLDLVGLASKVAELGDKALSEALTAMTRDAFEGGSSGARRLGSPDAEAFLATVRSAQAQVKRFDANGDGALNWDEQLPSRSSVAGEKAVTRYLATAKALHAEPSREEARAAQLARLGIQRRSQLDVEVRQTVAKHVQGDTAREAVLWSIRAEVAEGTEYKAHNLDRSLASAETQKPSLMDRIAGFFGGSKAHLDDAEVRAFLKTDDLQSHAGAMREKVQQSVGGWDAYLAGKDISGVERIDELLRAMPQGTVKWFNPDKGYGFISPEGGGEEIFVHFSKIQTNGHKVLNEGQRVVFEVTQGRKGREASNVMPLD